MARIIDSTSVCEIERSNLNGEESLKVTSKVNVKDFSDNISISCSSAPVVNGLRGETEVSVEMSLSFIRRLFEFVESSCSCEVINMQRDKLMKMYKFANYELRGDLNWEILVKELGLK